MATATSVFVSRNLMPGERVVVVSRIHPKVIIPPAVLTGLGFLLSLVGLIGRTDRGEPLLLVAAVGVPMFLIAGGMLVTLLVARTTTEFSCTDRRILIKTGLLSTQLREMPLAKVENLAFHQGLFGKILGYGTLVFKGSGGTRRYCRDIENPFDFYQRVQQQVAKAQAR